jgi:hypothetical protein
MALGECSAVLRSGRFPTLELALAVLLLVPVSAFGWARAGDSADTSSLDSPVDTEAVKIPVVEGKDIRSRQEPPTKIKRDST